MPSAVAATRYPWPLIIAAVLGTALAYMSDDMLNLAIPSVARDLGATVTDAQWVLNAYYVSLVSSVLVMGSVGDIWGHRRVFIGGMSLFAGGALVCALAPAVAVLVCGRFVQGVGAAALLASGLALVMRLSPLDERNRSVGLFLGLVAAVPAVGPFASGALVDLLSWRWLFVVPLVLPAAALLITWWRVPETPRAPGRRPDIPGAALAFATLAALSVALIAGSAPAIALAAAAAAAFAWYETRAPDPLLPPALFRRRRFVAGNLIWLVACLTSWGAVFFVAVGIQAVLGQPAVVAGLALVPIYLLMMVGSPLAGRLADRIGPRLPIVGGLLLYGLGLALLGRMSPTASVALDILPAVLVLGMGMAVFTAPLAAATLGDLGAQDQGIASGVNNAMGQLAGLLGVVVLPLLAGLSGLAFGDPAFAAGAARALLIAACLVVPCVALAALAFPSPQTKGGSWTC